ncbi:MAG: hypothetical protein K9K67_13125 [Bacteriovoracaceae bacterium]|nr:hypothetical protein [Bacteriovoracaceae bacterium]
MALPDFLKNKNKPKKGKKKQDFRERCLELLEKIKEVNNDRYHELLKTFRDRYDKINVPKKVISGFYAQLVQEYNTLRESAGETIIKTTKRVASHHRVIEIQEKLKKRAEEIEEETKQLKKTTKKVANKVLKAAETLASEITKDKPVKKTKKKEASKKKVVKKKAPEKKVAKKKAPEKKVAKKKAPEKKVAKKKAPEKKVAKKKAPEKKVAKKKVVAKKAPSKVTKKKVVKKKS